MKKFIIILQKFVIVIITTFFTLLLIEIFSRNFIKNISTKIFHFDKNALIWNQEISSHVFKKPSKSIMTNGHFKEYIFIDKNGFRINSPEEIIINPSAPVFNPKESVNNPEDYCPICQGAQFSHFHYATKEEIISSGIPNDQFTKV